MDKNSAEKYKELLDVKRELLLSSGGSKAVNTSSEEREGEILAIFEKSYLEAKALFASGKKEALDEAVLVFDILEDYKNSRELKEECERPLKLIREITKYREPHTESAEERRAALKRAAHRENFLVRLWKGFWGSKKAKLTALLSLIGALIITAVAVFVIYPSQMLAQGNFGAYVKIYGLKEFTAPNENGEIARGEYLDCKSLERVVISDGVTKISEGAFLLCTGLKEVVIPSSVSVIESYAFSDVSEDVKIYYGGTLEEWLEIHSQSWGSWGNNDVLVSGNVYFYSESEPELVYNSWRYVDGKITVWEDIKTEYSQGLEFAPVTQGVLIGEYCSEVVGIGSCTDTIVKIPPISPSGERVVQIAPGAFKGTASIKEVILPDSVTFVGREAFMGCTSLERIDLSDSVTEIWSEAFMGCTSLKEAVIRGGGYMEPNVFADCTALERAYLLGKFINLDSGFFKNCTSLKDVIIPTCNVVSGAFEGCDSIEHIYLNGEGYFSFEPSDVVYRYSESKPTESGSYWHYVDGVPTPWESIDSGSLEVEISDIQQIIRYVDDDGMVIPITDTELSIGKNYTLELTFTITPNENSDGQRYLNTVLSFADISILNGTIKEAETGKQIENQVIDAATGTDRRSISLSFKIPAEAGVEKQITILVGLEPLSATSDSEMRLEFSSDDAKISGSDGISRSFTISAATLAAPVITYDAANMKVKWRHVKNATYYLVFAEGVNTGIIIQAAGETAGAEMMLDILEHNDLYGKSITIQAFSDSEYFSASDKSNAVIAQ